MWYVHFEVFDYTNRSIKSRTEWRRRRRHDRQTHTLWWCVIEYIKMNGQNEMSQCQSDFVIFFCRHIFKNVCIFLYCLVSKCFTCCLCVAVCECMCERVKWQKQGNCFGVVYKEWQRVRNLDILWTNLMNSLIKNWIKKN